MKKLMWIISILSLVITLIVLQLMPEQIPMHFDMAGNVDRWGSRYESLLFPVIILVLAVFMSLLIRMYERKAGQTKDDRERVGALSNARVLGIAGAAMSAMFCVMQCFILYGAYRGAKTQAETAVVDIGKISCILMGIMFIVLGNFMTKTRINGTVGVRISWSMYNDNTWRRTNRAGSYVLMLAGLLTIMTAVLMKSTVAATIAMFGYLMLAVIIILIYAHKVYLEEISSEKVREEKRS